MNTSEWIVKITEERIPTEFATLSVLALQSGEALDMMAMVSLIMSRYVYHKKEKRYANEDEAYEWIMAKIEEMGPDKFMKFAYEKQSAFLRTKGIATLFGDPRSN